MALATNRRQVLHSSGRRSFRGSTLIVFAAYPEKPSRLGHLLPKKGAQRKSAANHQPAPCCEEHPAPVSQEQLILAAQILAQDEELYDGPAELNIISSLDLDDVLQEADRLHCQLTCPDLDILRQYGPLLVGRFDEQARPNHVDTVPNRNV